MDLALRLNETAVMTLLMGTSLYPTRYAAIRELIQNSVDACLVRSYLHQQPTYKPKVEISNEFYLAFSIAVSKLSISRLYFSISSLACAILASVRVPLIGTATRTT